jgi:acyl-CoA thioesterase I
MPTGGCRRPGRRRARGPVLLAALALVVGGCGQATPTPSAAPVSTAPAVTPPAGPLLRYIALGDSYTIGTSVAERERWPNQLVAREPRLELVANLAANGLTSRDVIEVELPQLDALRPDFLTLLIGVNDVVQGVPAETYRRNVVRILEDAVERIGANRVLVVTTPDYTVTPAGSDYGAPVQQAAGIRENNAIINEVARALGIAVVDIHDISLEAATEPSLVAFDGLHPSGAQYARWVERILPSVATLLGE